jgi:glyoxylate utilization-related uncharacterized protein
MVVELLEGRITPASFFMSMPNTSLTAPGDTGTIMSFPINVNALTDGTRVGLSAANIAINFPLGVFTFPSGSNAASVDVTLGSNAAWTGYTSANWTISANAPNDGVLNIQVSAKPGHNITTNAGAGTLVLVNFPVNHTYNPSASTAQAIKVLAANGTFHTQVSANSGIYVLSPLPPYSGTVTITPIVEQPPTITTPQNYTTEANATINAPDPGLLVGAKDPQLQLMQVTTIDGAPYTPGSTLTLPSGAMLTVPGISGGMSHGGFTYVPGTNFVGTDTFTFVVTDQNGNASTTGTANILVVPTLTIVPDPINPDPTGSAGAVIREDVVLDNPNPGGNPMTGLAGFNLAITYDGSAITTDPAGAGVLLGAGLPADWSFTPNASNSGVLAIGAFGTGSGTDLVSTTSSVVLVTIDFTITSSFTQMTPILLVPMVTFAGGSSATSINGTGVTYNIQPPLSDTFIPGVDTEINITGTTSTVTLTTTANPTSEVVGSGPLNDTATLSGGTSPTGSITFTLTGPGGSTVDTETVAISGDGTYSTPTGFVPTTAGGYSWVATYSGDAANPSVTSAAEPVTVTAATTSLATTPNPASESVGSGPLNDTATLSGGFNATGTITFTLTAPGGSVVDTETAPVSGNGTYSTPTGFVPTTAGSYSWQVTYSGDTNNSTASSPNEPVTVTQASPSVATTANPTTEKVGSGALTDTATLSGGFNPTGSITFKLTGPGGSVVDTETATVSGDGTYSTPTGFVPTTAGSYFWVASYSGDSNNTSATSANEPVTVTPASPSLTTTANPTSEVVGSGALKDSATLSGGFNPTGTITFKLTGPGSTVVDTETATVSGNGTYSTPTGFVPTTAGSYFWVASYSGDTSNTTATSANEPVTVTQASPSLATTANPTSEVVGSGALKDTATLSGGFNATGTITFKLTGPGSTVVDTETATVSGNGTYSTPTGFVPTTVGSYFWVASYSGDTNNTTATSANEPVTVTQASPSLATTANPTTEVVGSGALKDSATLSAGFNPTGTITFKLTGPGSTVVDTETATVSGNGTYSTPTGFTPTTAGSYFWVASYGGDTNNQTASSANEPVTVTKASPGITTTANPNTEPVGTGALKDSATLSGGFNPTGTITFTLTDPSSTVVDTETVTVSGNGTYATPTGKVPTTAGTYHWVASYSGDGNNLTVASGATDEPVVVTPVGTVTLTTTANPTTEVVGTAALKDTATLSGGTSPTGTITFTLTGPGGSTVDTEMVSVSGNGTYSTPTGFVPTTAGSYSWVASYSGDPANSGATSSPEPVSVTQASASVTTTANPTTEVVGSGALKDTATLSSGFNPTGTITFTLTGPGGGTVDTESVTVSGNGTYSTPTGFTPTTAGSYSWSASYNGDTNNKNAASAAEPVTVSQVTPSLATTANPTSETVGSGALKDTATLSGGFNATGTITFKLTGPGSTVVDTETATVSGNGTYSTPTGFVPTTAGAYFWVASYSGDTNNQAATSANEPVTVTKASPGITTTANPTTEVVGTGALKDTATLSGGFNPTGSITFTLTDPSSTVVDTETVTVSGNGTYSTPTGKVPTTAGTYHWVASYSGDTNNQAAASGATSEPVVVTPLSGVSITTTANPTTEVVGTAALKDTATLSGGTSPTGIITFTLTGPGGATVDTEMVSVSGNGTYSTPTGFVPTTAGSYSWVASYGGDPANSPATSSPEPVTVTQASPSVTTTANPTSEVVGSGALKDTATLSGGFNPTGSITFTLTGPGGGTVDTETVTVSGDGTYSTPTGKVPTTAGAYVWTATYSGDTNNKAFTSANEPVTVTQASPSLTTTANPTSEVVGSGALKDTATLSSGFSPTGSITFKLTGPGSTVVDTETVTVSGNGTYATPTGFTPTTAGSYFWVASYSGDTNNTTATSANEPVTVTTATTSLTTTANPTSGTVSVTTLKDTATLSGGFSPTGSITFTLTDPTSTVVDTETVAVSGNGTYATPTGFVPTTTGTYNWVAVYSGDTNNTNATSSKEPVTVAPLGNLDVPAGTTMTLTGTNKYNMVTIEGTLTDNGSLMANSVKLDGPGAVLNGTGSVMAPVAVTGAGSGSSIGGSLTLTNPGGTAIDVQAGANNVTISGATVTGSGVGIMVEPGSGNMTSVTGDTITKNAEGVEVLNGCITVTGNIIGGASGAGNNDGVYIPASSNPLLTLEGNNISFNSVNGLNNQSTMGVTAILNWWGNVGGPGAVDGAGRNPIVGASEDNWAPYALDTTSVGPSPTTFNFFNGTGADGNVYVTGTLGTDTIVATVDAVNTNVVHVTGSASPGNFTRGTGGRIIIYGFGDNVAGAKDSITFGGDTAAAPWNAQINSEALKYREPSGFSGTSSTKISVTGSGSDVIFGGGNDNISDKTSGNDVIVVGQSTGKTGAPTAPQVSTGTGSNIIIAGFVDCTLAPEAATGRLDYETLSAMDAVWASSTGGMGGAMGAAALYDVANTPGAIKTGSARAVIIPAVTGGKNWYIVKGAGNPVNTPTGLDQDYIAGSSAAPSYRQPIA